MADSFLRHPLLMLITITVNLCLISTAESPPASPSTAIPPPPPPPLPSLPTTMVPPPLPSLPKTMAPPPQPAPSLPATTSQPLPPIPSVPTIIPPPTLPPIPSVPTIISPPPLPPLPSLPTTALPPSPPPTTTSTPPSPSPPTMSSIPPASLPTTAPTSPATTTSSPPPPPRTTTSPPPAAPDVQEDQFDNIIDALMGAGDFGAWASILSAADLSGFPLAATLFIPSNDAISHFPTATTATLNFDPFIIPYHIIPHRLSFSDLQRFKTHTRLPTLLPSKTLLITNNSPFNFTINDSPITHPDLYATTTVSVHGIKTILDYSSYGSDGHFVPEDTIPRPSPPQEAAPPFFEAGEIMGRRRSDAACLCTEFPIVLSVVCAALAFKIHRNPLTR